MSAVVLSEPQAGSPRPGALTGRMSRGSVVTVSRLAFVVVVGFLVLDPLIRLQLLAFGHGLSGYSQAVHSPDFAKVVETTVYLALGSLVIALVLGTALASFAIRVPPRWQWMSVLPILPIVIPAVANVTGWAFLLSPRVGYLNIELRRLSFLFPGSTGPVDIYSVPWIIVLTGFGLTSFVYVFVRTGLRDLNEELMEAAQVSGASPLRTYLTVVIPLLRPVLLYGGGIALLLGLGQFTAPLLLGGQENVQVLTTQMYNYTSQPPVNFPAAAAIGSPLLLAGIIVVFLQRVALGDQSRFVTHGGRAVRSPVRSSRWSVVPLGLYALVAIVLPLVGLVIVSLSPFYSAHIHPSHWTLDNFRSLFKGVVYQSVKTSILASAVGVVITVPLGYLAATILHDRSRGRFSGRLLDFIVNLPLGVPAVVFGVGFLYSYSRPPLILYGKTAVFVVVYVTLMLPYATRMLLGARMALGDQYVWAARVSGAGPLRVHAQIIAPLLRTAMAGAAALILVLLQQEFSASVLVRSGTSQVMGTQLFDLWTTSGYPEVAAMALLMCAITGVGVAIVTVLGGRPLRPRNRRAS